MTYSPPVLSLFRPTGRTWPIRVCHQLLRIKLWENMKTRSIWVTHICMHAHTLTPQYHQNNSAHVVMLCCFLISDKLNYADSVINKVTLMQKQKDADTYVHTIVNICHCGHWCHRSVKLIPNLSSVSCRYRVKDKSDRATVEQVGYDFYLEGPRQEEALLLNSLN